MSDLDGLIQALDDKLVVTDDPLEMAEIYHQAGILFSQHEEIDEACFFMTQAYIIASEHGEESIVQETREFLKQHHRI